jgi:hypothetical protein
MCRDTFAGVSQKNSRRTGSEHTVVVELQYGKVLLDNTKEYSHCFAEL